jgi:uncharacterized protein with NAD-binding domain and iron-sulfur cluster
MVDNDTWYRFFRRRPDRPLEVLEALELLFQTLDFDAADLKLLGAKILQFFTSCEARRFGTYEHLSWWQFLQGDDYSRKLQRQLRAIPRTMVAMDPKRGSARTIGTIVMQLLLDFASTGMTNDRTMGGPTSEMWIDPWIAHLQSRGVQLHAGVAVDGLDVGAGRISGVRLAGDLVPRVADFYVLAVPIEQAIAMITPQMGALDPTLETLRTSHADELVSWMVGAQYFLKEDVPLVRGHTFYPDAPWALTSISQAQFWTEGGAFRDRYGDGTVGGVLSVDISDWDTPGDHVRKPAKQCTPAEIRHEIWEQLKAALNGRQPGDLVLSDALVHSFHLDADLDYAAGMPPTNHSRLLVHPPGSWAVRPEAATQIPNLVLAGDYVRTHTDRASMEGACEAARRAVNTILQRAGSRAIPATIWPLSEPEPFEPWKHLDARLHAAGRGHVFELLGIRHAGAAAELLRRFNEVSGLAALDDLLDDVRVTETIRIVWTRLGLRADRQETGHAHVIRSATRTQPQDEDSSPRAPVRGANPRADVTLVGVIGDVRTMEEVVAAMRTVDSVLPDDDGVKWFNLLYLRVMEAVQAEVTVWQDRPFLERFDVVFASLYFDAILNWEQDRASTPHAWRPLLAARHETRLAKIQFALAGMNAHINRDLAVALDRMAARDGRFPSNDGARYHDFRRVNDVLEEVEASLRPVLATGLVGKIDAALDDLDSILTMWNVRKAREAAWTNGEVLWHLRAMPLLQRDYLARLDQLTSFAGRGLLVPPLGLRTNG